MSRPVRGFTTMTDQIATAAPISLGARVRSWFAASAGHGSARTEVGDSVSRTVSASDQARLLLTEWQAHSLQVGWFSRSDWWDPACDAVVESLVAGTDVRPPVGRLGNARAQLGCTIEETLDDLAALYVVRGVGVPPVDVIRALAAGWAESGLREIGAASCYDTATGLTTRAYLEARLGELYRDGRPGHPADALCLIVVDVDAAPGLPGLPMMCRISEVLRRTFTQGHTIARIASGRFVALAPVGPALPAQLKSVESSLCEPEVAGASLWVESLPRTFGLVPGLLDDLGR